MTTGDIALSMETCESHTLCTESDVICACVQLYTQMCNTGMCLHSVHLLVILIVATWYVGHRVEFTCVDMTLTKYYRTFAIE